MCNPFMLSLNDFYSSLSFKPHLYLFYCNCICVNISAAVDGASVSFWLGRIHGVIGCTLLPLPYSLSFVQFLNQCLPVTDAHSQWMVTKSHRLLKYAPPDKRDPSLLKLLWKYNFHATCLAWKILSPDVGHVTRTTNWAGIRRGILNYFYVIVPFMKLLETLPEYFLYVNYMPITNFVSPKDKCCFSLLLRKTV